MKKSDIEKLKKHYPADKFVVIESQGNIIVSPKRSVIRIRQKHASQLGAGSAEKLSAELSGLMNKKKLSADDFKVVQVSIFKDTADRLREEARKCKTRIVMYIDSLVTA